MQYIKNPFIKMQKKEAQDILEKYSVEIPNNFLFADINIVIGANGSGKTRFLRAVRESYDADDKVNIMYGYFPQLSPHKASIVKNDELPVCTLYESLQESKVDFKDFLKEIERHNEEYIPQLLIYHSKLQKKRGEKALKTLKEAFLAISGKELLLVDGDVLVKDKNNITSPLKDAIFLFSPGELMIFYMSVFLSLQENSSQKRVIILDEPECHLHPKALLQFIQIIKESGYFTSLWIATHSLFLIPEFEFENIVYIENSKIVSRTSRLYKDVLSDLLGDENNKTTQFIESLSKWQYCQFIAECFREPEVIDKINPEDEQVKLFLKWIENQKFIKILDFGGGSGRLGLSLKLSNCIEAQQITYEIYDMKPTYTGKEFVVYNSLDAIEEKYDCIVMMNVLHEIEPDKWAQVFADIRHLLKDGAYLLFVETAALNKGEMPNKTGFLVLDSEELKVLFATPKPMSPIILKEGQKSVCIPVPKTMLGNVTERTICEAIVLLEKRMLNAIKKERKKENFQNSRYYAFLLQQYINAKLFNDSHSIFPSKKKIAKSGGNKEIGLKNLLSFAFGNISKGRIAGLLKKYLNTVKLTEIDLSICKEIEKGLEALIFGENVSREYIQKCWKEILLLERKHAAKNIISLFLICLHVMGDERCENRINNNGYFKYVEQIIKELAREYKSVE